MEINKKRKKKGFTLVELLVVLGIIGIISAIAAPTVLSKIDDAKQKTDVANAASIAMAVKSEMASGNEGNNLTKIATDYFDGIIPKPQTAKGQEFSVKIEGNVVKVSVGNNEFYPEQKPMKPVTP